MNFLSSTNGKAEARVPLPGSEKSPPLAGRDIGAVDPSEKILVTLILKPRNSTSRKGRVEELSRTPVDSRRRHLTREEFSQVHGALQSDFDLISEFARQYGLELVAADPAMRSALLSGSTQQMTNAFGVELRNYEHPTMQGGTFRGRSGPIYLPASLANIVQAVLGLDSRPQAYPHLRPLLPGKTAAISYTPPEVAKLYDYPEGLNGQGQCIGIIELGGGTVQNDLEAYFHRLGIAPPRAVSVSVDGGSNSPTGDPNGPDGEVMLDVEVAGSIANGATLVLYFAPNTDQGFVDAVSTAIHDNQNKPTVLSISWGGPENTWTSQAISALNQALEDASLLGVTVCVASGDGGSSDGVSDGLAHVDFPASSPYALGCGGTSLPSISNEVVWNDQPQDGATGGGISDVFPLPSWQGQASVPPSANPGGKVGRGVPDVAGDADPATGYSILVDGQEILLGGTSAVAPLWAALFALINQKLEHPIGYFNPMLYQKQLSADLHDITRGNNGAYSARSGWNACTGFGSPDGSKLLNAFLSVSAS